MQTETVSLHLAAIPVPEPKLNKGKGYVEWGSKHSFPATVLGLIRNSPTAAAMKNRMAEYIAGEGFSIDAEGQPELAEWLKLVQATQLLEPTGVDAAHLESYAWQVVWSKTGGTIQQVLEIHHQPIDTVAWGKKNEKGEVETYYLCDDWSKAGTADFPVKEMPAFNAKKPGSGAFLYVFHKYTTGQRYYQALAVEPCLNDMATEGELGKYRKNAVETRFGGNTLISIKDGPKDKSIADPADPTKTITITAKSQRQAFTDGLKKKHQGSEADGIVIVWGDGTVDAADKMVKVEPLSTASPETYEKISDQAQQAILSAGGVTSPAVIGLPTNAGLGGGGTEIREAYEMYDNSVALPWRRRIVASLLELFAAGGQALAENDSDTDALTIVNTLPVRQHFSEDTLASTLEDDEIRQAEGWKPKKKPEEAKGSEPVQTEAQKQLSASVGGQSSIDAMLNLLATGLTTRESCIARLKTFYGMTEEQAQEIVPRPDQITKVPAGTL